MPSKTPPAMVQSVYHETSRIVAMPEGKEKLEDTGHTVVNSPPAVFSDKVRQEVEKFRKIIIASKMQQD